jgi:hypothetical protein
MQFTKKIFYSRFLLIKTSALALITIIKAGQANDVK